MNRALSILTFFMIHQNAIIKANVLDITKKTLDIMLKRSSREIFSVEHPALPPSINNGLRITLHVSLPGAIAVLMAASGVSPRYNAAGAIISMPIHKVPREITMISCFIAGAVTIGCTTVFNSKNAAASMLSTKENQMLSTKENHQHNAISDVALQAKITNIYD